MIEREQKSWVVFDIFNRKSRDIYFAILSEWELQPNPDRKARVNGQSRQVWVERWHNLFGSSVHAQAIFETRSNQKLPPSRASVSLALWNAEIAQLVEQRIRNA